MGFPAIDCNGVPSWVFKETSSDFLSYFLVTFTKYNCQFCSLWVLGGEAFYNFLFFGFFLLCGVVFFILFFFSNLSSNLDFACLNFERKIVSGRGFLAITVGGGSVWDFGGVRCCTGGEVIFFLFVDFIWSWGVDLVL